MITNIILDGSPDGTETEDEEEVLRAEREEESNSESSDSGDDLDSRDSMSEDEFRGQENRGRRIVRGEDGILRVHSQE